MLNFDPVIGCESNQGINSVGFVTLKRNWLERGCVTGLHRPHILSACDPFQQLLGVVTVADHRLEAILWINRASVIERVLFTNRTHTVLVYVVNFFFVLFHIPI